MYTVVLMAALTTGPAATGHFLNHCTGCHGCQGGHAISGYCHGCQGCSGCTGCYGNYYGCAGNYTIYAPPPCAGVFGCTGCYGCYGGWSCYGVALPHHGYWNECVPGVAAPDKTSPKLEETPLPSEQKSKVSIDVPADAKVYVDGQLMKAGKRVFQTPELVPGQTYFYDVRVEIERDGQTSAETQRVLLRPGQTVTAAFPNLSQGTTATAQTER